MKLKLKLLVFLAVFQIFTFQKIFAYESSSPYWSTYKNGPVTTEQAIEMFFKDRPLDPIEGIWTESKWGLVAITKDGKTVQIKTNHAAQQIGFRGKADLILVIHVEEDGSWDEIYFGDHELVEKNSTFSARDNKRMISITKLKTL